MTRSLEPPAERPLPARRQAALRARIVQATNQPRHGIRRLAPVVLALAVVAASAFGLVAGLAGDRRPDVPALGGLSPSLRRAVDTCFEKATHFLDGGPPRLVNYDEAGDVSVVVVLNDTQMYVCFMDPDGAATSSRPYHAARWLPGPISVQAASSGDGDVYLAGRVSARAARVELEHGDGRRTIARLAEGTFAVATAVAGIADSGAALVTYDHTGAVIDRRDPLHLEHLFDRSACWVDTSGTVVYGDNPGHCQLADPWP